MKHRNEKACKTYKKIKKTYSNKRDVESIVHEKNQNLDDKKKHIRKDDNDDYRNKLGQSWAKLSRSLG